VEQQEVDAGIILVPTCNAIPNQVHILICVAYALLIKYVKSIKLHPNRIRISFTTPKRSLSHFIGALQKK
jgi:hypothetical protein